MTCKYVYYKYIMCIIYSRSPIGSLCGGTNSRIFFNPLIKFVMQNGDDFIFFSFNP